MNLVLLLVIGIGDASPATCSLFLRHWVRHDSASYIIAVAQADTALAVYWTAPVIRLRPDAPPPRPITPRPIYGQRVRVERASRAATRADAVVIFWGMDSMCSRVPGPGSALVLTPGTEFFLESRARDSLTSEGLATFDYGPATRLYSPAEARVSAPRSWRTLWLRPAVLSLAEYEDLYRSLPTWSAWESDPRGASESVRVWARAHPRLARRIPARGIIEGMELELRELERSSRPGR